MAVWQRRRNGQVINDGKLLHHSDAGSQYLGFRFSEELMLEGILASVGSVGDAYDNARPNRQSAYLRPRQWPRTIPSISARSRQSRTWNTPPQVRSTGTTIAVCIPQSATSHQPNLKSTTALHTWHPNRRCHTHEAGTENRTVHRGTRATRMECGSTVDTQASRSSTTMSTVS